MVPAELEFADPVCKALRAAAAAAPGVDDVLPVPEGVAPVEPRLISACVASDDPDVPEVLELVPVRLLSVELMEMS